MKKIIALCLISLFFWFSGHGQNKSFKTSVTIKRDLVYKQIDQLDLRLSLIIPENSKRTDKLLIILPDELKQERSEYESLAIELANKGFIISIVDYRQPPDYSYPKSIEDILNAIDWLEVHSREFDIRIKATGLTGQNFGGYLASLIGLAYPVKIQTVIAMHAPMDLTTYEPPWGYPYRYNAFIGKPLMADTIKWKELSPLYNIRKSGPAFLLMHGNIDELVPVNQSAEMERALKKILAPVKFIQVDTAGNGYFTAKRVLKETAAKIAYFCNQNMVELPGSLTLQKDIVYARAGSKKLHLDMFKPKNSNRLLPAILFFHGGGWVWGRKEDMTQNAAELASKGYVTFTVEYRLAREAQYPACVDDAKAAVRWIKSNAKKIGVNPDKIGVVGSSAGGHIAAMLGVTPYKKFIGEFIGPKDPSADVHAVATLSGVVDMLALYPRDSFSPVVLLGTSPKEDERAYMEASPIYLATKTPSKFLFIHGSDDHLGIVDEMIEMAEKLKNANVEAEVFVIDGGEHDFLRHKEYRSQGINKLLEFMDSNLKTNK